MESSLRVTRCRQILRSLPDHNYVVLCYLMGFLHAVSGQGGALGVKLSGLPCHAGPAWTSPLLALGLGSCPTWALEYHSPAPKALIQGLVRHPGC